MTDEIRGEKPEVQGDTEPMNWACTACGANREDFDPVPVPGF